LFEFEFEFEFELSSFLIRHMSSFLIRRKIIPIQGSAVKRATSREPLHLALAAAHTTTTEMGLPVDVLSEKRETQV
jgi:hypothetical protein